MIEGVIVSPLKVINVKGGNVLHAIKASDSEYRGFGEAYFSMIEKGIIKGWKRHKEMTLNLIVPIGAIRFVLFDSRDNSVTAGKYFEVDLSLEYYNRLTIPPMIWMGFQGLEEGFSMLLNIANIPHSKSEVEQKELNEIYFDWRSN
jgi:dTDP-4-dehydrorhamnose 3,5-epimerase